MLTTTPIQRDYQREMSDFIVQSKGRAYCGDDTGLGKTGEVLEAIKRLQPQPSLILVICPKSAFGTWKVETHKWLQESVAFYPGDPPKPGTRFVVTNYERLADIVNIRLTWDAIVVDEAHMLRNRKTQRFKNFKKLRSTYLIALSGSPFVNGVDDLWTMLNAIDRKRFGSYWAFYKRHVLEDYDLLGNVIKTEIRSIPKLRKEISPYFLRRVKEQVLNDLPPKIRQPLYATMTPTQAAIYKELTDVMMTDLSRWRDQSQDPIQNELELLTLSGYLDLHTRLRQTLVTPALWGGPNESGALNLLTEHVALSFDANLPVFVTTPYARAFPYIEEALSKSDAEYITTHSGQLSADE